MKSCDGCCWLFKDRMADQELPFCRALPPVMRFDRNEDGTLHVGSCYPLAPKVRCGMFKRRWPWMRNLNVPFAVSASRGRDHD
jgi:hypothetical protein